MASREELHQAAAEVIGYMKTISEFSDARVSVIGGLALWMYTDDRTTQDIDFIINIDSAPASVKQKLMDLPNSPFTQRAQMFYYATSSGGSVQVDSRLAGSQSPYIPASAQALKSIPPGVVPYISPTDLVVFKINACGLRAAKTKKGVDAMDAQNLLIAGTNEPISLTTEQQAIVENGLADVLAYTSMPEEWWRAKMGMPSN